MLTWVLGEVIITDCPGAIASTAPNTLTLAFCATPLLHPACRRHPARRRYADAGRTADALADAGRAADALADTGRAADALADAGRVAGRVEDAGKTADALTDAGRTLSRVDDARRNAPGHRRSSGASLNDHIPQHAKDVANYAVNNNGNAPSGYVGNRPFRNDGRNNGAVLPRTDPNGNPITYKEYDVHPYQRGVNRGAERVVIGSDGSKYYTDDHYRTFKKFE